MESGVDKGMSGVYIKGLKMPTDFSGTRLIIYPNGQVLFPHKTYFDELHGVEAIPVPDHGRLVDADALYKDLLEDVGYGEAERFNDYWLGEQPTIIPADKEGEA